MRNPGTSIRRQVNFNGDVFEAGDPGDFGVIILHISTGGGFQADDQGPLVFRYLPDVDIRYNVPFLLQRFPDGCDLGRKITQIKQDGAGLSYETDSPLDNNNCTQNSNSAIIITKVIMTTTRVTFSFLFDSGRC